MGRRRIETYQYREVLGRMQAGDSDRDLARAGLLGRDRAASFRGLAREQGWEEQGVQGTTIHAALRRDHGFTGSYSSVVRFLHGLREARQPDVTTRLLFAPGEAAQVDFGAGPLMRVAGSECAAPCQHVKHVAALTDSI
jgi:hypothetical protein